MSGMGVGYIFFYYVKHAFNYRTITLGSTRVYTDTSAVLLNNITVSNFTFLDSFTFNTQSGGVTDIYITDCKLYNKSVSIQGSIESVRRVILGQFLTAGSSIKMQIETESGNCSTKLTLFDHEGWEDGDKYAKTGAKKKSYKEQHCISKPSHSLLFKPHKTSYCSLVIEAHEKAQYSLTGDMLTFHGFVRCSISNTTNCSVSQKWFASEATVCVIAITRASDIPHSDIEYGITKVTVPLWKKIAYYFIMIVVYGVGIIPSLLLGVVQGLYLYWYGLHKNKICIIILIVMMPIGLVLLACGLYYDISFFVKICAL